MSAIPPCPYVLRLVAACTDPPALVTEYCARGSLYSLLHSPATPAMPLKQVMNIWLGVARGMAHLHACTPPVLHRGVCGGGCGLGRGVGAGRYIALLATSGSCACAKQGAWGNSAPCTGSAN